jgi:hypothetical protein
MNVVASQSIRCSQQHEVEGAKGGLVTQMVEARALEFGATIAIVAEDVFFGQTPVSVSGDGSAQAVKLLVDRMRLLLPAGRDPGIECDAHGRPPEG